MVQPLQTSDLAATLYFRERLPKQFIQSIPSTIIDGYAGANRVGPPHIAGRRGATDRYWSVQAAWHDLGQVVDGMNIVNASSENGGGPFIALEYSGTLLTVHKTDSETAPPRASESRKSASTMNDRYQETLFDFAQYPQLIEVTDGAEYLSGFSREFLRAFNLYVLITHCPGKDGEFPVFISGIVIDRDNRVLARVDVKEEAMRIAADDLVELEQAVEILKPQPRRRARGDEASSA